MARPFPAPSLSPNETARALAGRVRALRLDRDWKRDTLAARSGVSAASLKRFERTGQVSLDSFLRLCEALGRLPELDRVLVPPVATSLADLERASERRRKRGRR